MKVKLKKATSIYITIVLLISISVATTLISLANSAISVYSTNVTANAGETVRIPIYMDGSQNVLGFKLMFDYDASLMTPLSVEAGSQISGGLQDNIDGDAVAGSFNVYWASSDAKVFSRSAGAVFYVNFSVKETAKGETTLRLSYSQEDTFDDDFNDVSFTFRDPSTITINNTNISENYMICQLLGKTDSSEYANNTNVIAGSYVDVTVDTISYNFDNNIPYSDVTFGYDKESFEFVGVYNFDDEVVANSTISDNTLTFSTQDIAWTHIRFKAKNFARRGSYQFNLNVDTSELDRFECTPLTVNVKPSATSEIAQISIPDDLCSRAGLTITVPIMISNNHGIMGYKLNVEFNPQHLEAVSATSAFAGNFDNTIGQKNDEFYVIWNTTEDNSTNGELMYVTFNVLTDVELESEITLTYSQPDTFNELYEDVVFSCNNNSIYLNCSHSAFASRTVDADCENDGYTEYTCQKCSESYRNNFTSAIGHLYRCNRDFSTKTFTYYCEDCNKQATKNVSELEAIWSSQYINLIPKRTIVDDSCYLDVVQVNFVNGKDFAAIHHTAKYAK